jgi:hypothetical protein
MPPKKKKRTRREEIQKATRGQLLATFFMAIALISFLTYLNHPTESIKKPSPEETVNQFFKSLNSEDTERIKELSEGTFYENNIDAIQQLFAQANLDFGGALEPIKYKTSIDGDKADVVITEGAYFYTKSGEIQPIIVFLEKQDFTLQFHLISIDGTWKITAFNISDLFIENIL